ncbi:MBL fold metallo-hydrolase [Dyadobacter sediminis]|uniref:MBL fold metallo-hydrolase n=1 Tax=Dyadobacter sediminis TaxID=1493691 RepID=A0A5R9KJD3_9BACT|nr:MBL fold metallo-hydrolase [Dyadobacter sediminis]TLU96331.1 MBL fold metallo-hydrolase [Dyadobacter sediminis]GGB81354.1 MBL fold metallo-hydrolase [Dyadobacter sediminis]
MKPVELTVIGCSDAFGSGGRRNTCFHIKTASNQFLIDCGASAYPGLKELNINPEEISTIIISHFHGDHYGGLPFFLLEAAEKQRTKPITIVSPPGCSEKMHPLLALLYPGSNIMEKLNLRFMEFSDEQMIVNDDLELIARPVVHSSASLPHGIRIYTAGKIIAYSGDTEWTDQLISLAENADLFICECTFFTGKVKGHLNYAELKSHLPKMNFRKILLTHLDKQMLKNRHKIVHACAEDGMKILV